MKCLADIFQHTLCFISKYSLPFKFVILYVQVSNDLRQKLTNEILNLMKNYSRITFITGEKNISSFPTFDQVHMWHHLQKLNKFDRNETTGNICHLLMLRFSFPFTRSSNILYFFNVLWKDYTKTQNKIHFVGSILK